MKMFVISAVALAATGVGVFPAGVASAASKSPSTVDQTVSQLKAHGYNVILNKVGAAPLDQCSVVAVRPGQTFLRNDSGAPGAGNDIVRTVTDMTVYVDVNC